MRIVGMTQDEGMVIQTYAGEWKQVWLSKPDFLEFMKENFPDIAKKIGDDLDRYYYFGLTREEIAKGEAYIFKY